ncbi:MAG: spore coat protein [Halanaerobiales bacterium]
MSPQNQQQRTIKNPKSEMVPEVKSPDMNERDFLNDILATEKYLTNSYNTFAREASHTDLYNDIKQILNETHDSARNLFNIMFEEGFYSLKGATTQEIDKANQKFNNYLQSQSPY